MTAAGVVLNLALEQIALIALAARKQGKLSRQNSLEGIKMASVSTDSSNPHGEQCGLVKCSHTATHTEEAKAASYVDVEGQAQSNTDEVTQTAGGEVPEVNTIVGKIAEDIAEDESDDEGELLAGLMDAKTLKDMIQLYAMELSISVHSIIIGVDIGLLAGDSQMATLVSLLVAICFHQFVEGSGLGTILRTMRNVTSSAKVAVFVTVFSLTTPLGILIGVLTASQNQSPSQVAAKGIANSLACGSLLYISLTEMVATYFSSADLNDKPVLKLQMIAAFTFGIAAMAIIAIWA